MKKMVYSFLMAVILVIFIFPAVNSEELICETCKHLLFSTEQVYEYEQIDDEYHYEHYVRIDTCDHCGEIVSKVNIQSSYIAPHNCVDGRSCSCGYYNKQYHDHSIDGGKSYITKTLVDKHEEQYSYESREYHNAKYVYKYYCTLCEKELGEFVEENKEPHVFNSSNVCNCGYVQSTCAHQNVVSFGSSIKTEQIPIMGDNYYHKEINTFSLAQCTQCNKIITQETCIERKVAHDWYRHIGYCSSCGAGCAHPEIITEILDEYYVMNDEKSHSFVINMRHCYCSTCGKNWEENGDNYYVLPHEFNDNGICTQCGYSRYNGMDYRYNGMDYSCDHEGYIVDQLWVRLIDQNAESGTHRVTERYVEFCSNCHTVVGDFENYKEIVFDEPCVYVNHYCVGCSDGDPDWFVENPVCTHTGKLEQITSYTKELRKIQNNETHEYRYVYTGICDYCLQEVYKETEWMEEKHEFLNGICACGLLESEASAEDKCIHAEYIDVYDDSGERSPIIECLDEESHSVRNPYVRKCAECGALLAYPEGDDGYFPAEVKNHSFNEDGVCTVCDYTKSACQHLSYVDVYDDSGERSPIIASLGEEGHSIRNPYIRKCAECGVTLAYPEGDDGYFPAEVKAHSFNEDGACTICNYAKPACSHAASIHVYDDSGTRKALIENLGAEGHSIRNPYICKCAECGTVLEYPEGSDGYFEAEIEPHAFDGDGVCTICGYEKNKASLITNSASTTISTALVSGKLYFGDGETSADYQLAGIQYGESGKDWTATVSASMNADGTINGTVSGLKQNTSYRFRVVAQDTSGKYIVGNEVVSATLNCSHEHFNQSEDTSKYTYYFREIAGNDEMHECYAYGIPCVCTDCGDSFVSVIEYDVAEQVEHVYENGKCIAEGCGHVCGHDFSGYHCYAPESEYLDAWKQATGKGQLPQPTYSDITADTHVVNNPWMYRCAHCGTLKVEMEPEEPVQHKLTKTTCSPVNDTKHAVCKICECGRVLERVEYEHKVANTKTQVDCTTMGGFHFIQTVSYAVCSCGFDMGVIDIAYDQEGHVDNNKDGICDTCGDTYDEDYVVDLFYTPNRDGENFQNYDRDGAGISDEFLSNNLILKIDNIAYLSNEAWYGGIQHSPIYNVSDVYSILEEHLFYWGDFLEIEDAIQYLQKLDEEGCQYTALISTIFNNYKNDPVAFEKTFGYPMYKDNHLNYDMILVDFYCYAHEWYAIKVLTPSIGTIDVARCEWWVDFCSEHGVECDIIGTSFFNKPKLTYDFIADCYENGDVPIIGLISANLRNQNGDIVAVVDPHAMVITGVCVVNETYYLVVSSWGHAYLLDFMEAQQAMWCLYSVSYS